MMNKTINVNIKLVGWFPDIYYANKPKDMTDESYLNAIVSSWLIDRDEKKPIEKGLQSTASGNQSLSNVRGK